MHEAHDILENYSIEEEYVNEGGKWDNGFHVEYYNINFHSHSY